MAIMNPVLRLRRAFRSVAAPTPLSDEQADEVAEEAADAITSYSYSQRESDLRHAQMMADFSKEMAEFRTQVMLAILIATGVLLAALAAAVTVILSVLD